MWFQQFFVDFSYIIFYLRFRVCWVGISWLSIQFFFFLSNILLTLGILFECDLDSQILQFSTTIFMTISYYLQFLFQRFIFSKNLWPVFYLQTGLDILPICCLIVVCRQIYTIYRYEFFFLCGKFMSGFAYDIFMNCDLWGLYMNIYLALKVPFKQQTTLP